MRTNYKTVRPFPGPKVDRLPDGFAKRVISEALEPGGVPQADLTRWASQDCRWSDYLAEIAESNGCSCEMKRYGRRVWYFMRQQAA